MYFFQLKEDNSLTNRILKINLKSITFKVIDFIIDLSITFFVLKSLGSEQYGLWGIISSLIITTNFIDFGLSSSTRNILNASSINVSDEFKRTTISNVFFLLLLLSLIFGGIFYVLSGYIFIDTNYLKLNDNSLYGLISISLFLFSIRVFVLFFQNILMGVFLHWYVNAIETVCKSLIFTCWLFIIERTLTGFVILNLIIPIIVYFSTGLILFNTKLKYLRPSAKKIKLNLLPSVLKNGIKLYQSKLLNVFLSNSDNILIGYFFSTSEVAGYFLIKKIIQPGYLLINILTNTIWEGFKKSYEKNDIKWIKNSIIRNTKFIFFTSFLLTVGYLIVNKYQNILFHDKIKLDSFVFITLIICFLFRGINQIFSSLFNSLSLYSHQMYITYLGVAFYLFLVYTCSIFINDTYLFVPFSLTISFVFILIIKIIVYKNKIFK